MICPHPPQRILIIKPSAIGDIVHALPAAARLRRLWPQAHLSWLATPACAGLLEGHPMIDQVILFDRRGMARWWRSWRSASAVRALSRRLKEGRFDLVVDLQGLFRSGYLAFKTGAPVRVGLASAREGAGLFYTHAIDDSPADRHAIDRCLDVTRALGCPDGPVEFVFGVNDADRSAAAEMVKGIGRFAALLPGTNWSTKRWPAAHFAELARLLRERLGLQSVVAGGGDAAELAGLIPGAVNLAGRTTLNQLTALLERADLVVANDSGPMHIASALGRPLVALFGPTHPVRTGPYGRPDTVLRLAMPCAPCYSRSCCHQSCLRWLTAEQALNKARLQAGCDFKPPGA